MIHLSKSKSLRKKTPVRSVAIKFDQRVWGNSVDMACQSITSSHLPCPKTELRQLEPASPYPGHFFRT